MSENQRGSVASDELAELRDNVEVLSERVKEIDEEHVTIGWRMLAIADALGFNPTPPGLPPRPDGQKLLVERVAALEKGVSRLTDALEWQPVGGYALPDPRVAALEKGVSRLTDALEWQPVGGYALPDPRVAALEKGVSRLTDALEWHFGKEAVGHG